MPRVNSKRILAVDIGGSGIKAMILGSGGKPLTDRERLETPRPATPNRLIPVIRQLGDTLGDFDRVAVGFPGVIRNGVVETAANLDGAWIGYHLSQEIEKQLGRPARVANDADVQGLAAISGKGVELVLTLGTGLGSALFLNGIPLPNLEVAHHPFRKGRTYEEELGNAALERDGKKKWNKHVLEALTELEHMFRYDSVLIGGGNAKKIDFELPSNASIVPNRAGILGGAALWRNS